MQRSLMTFLTACGLVASAFAVTPAAAGPAKNVILMISDGQGFNTVKATEFYAGEQAVYEAFPVKFAMQTSSANNPSGYDPGRMWSSFGYSMTGATDSASAATAMYTGVKINDGVVNMTPTTPAAPVTTFFEAMAWAGKSIGAVTTVELSHATPAAVYAHNISRNNYAEIANEGIYGSNPGPNNAFYDSGNYNGNLKVLMGAGHPEYDSNNQFDPSVTDRYVGGTPTWTDIKDGTVPNGWTLVEDKAAFQALATGPTPEKVLGVAKANTTLQSDRTLAAKGADSANPSGIAFNADVPTLAEMTRAALNVLDNDPDGFAVMFEGGAVDWANHANKIGQMLEEQMDFNAAVKAAVDWVGSNSSWDETLLIVTADHETGHLWGAGSYTDTNGNGRYDEGVDAFLGYQQIRDNGDGEIPGYQYGSGDHTNSLVPLYAIGAGSELFADYVVGMDDMLVAMYGLGGATGAVVANNGSGGWTGAYIDNTSIFNVMQAAAVAEPATLALLGFGTLLVFARARRLAA